MLSKNEAKYIQSLGQKKNRDEQGVFIVEGPKLAEEILRSDFDILNIYALPTWQAPVGGLNVREISEIDLNRISGLQAPNQVVIVARQKFTQEPPVLNNHVVLVLDGLQDPGNMGTIIRTADWFGITQIICSQDCVEIYNPKVVQATMGSIFRMNVWYKPLEEWLEKVTVPVYGALLEGIAMESKKIEEGILIMGNESKGIRSGIRKHITNPVTIPRIGDAESLNVAVATGIILSHIC